MISCDIAPYFEYKSFTRIERMKVEIVEKSENIEQKRGWKFNRIEIFMSKKARRKRDKNQGMGIRIIGAPIIKLIHAQKSHTSNHKFLYALTMWGDSHKTFLSGW